MTSPVFNGLLNHEYWPVGSHAWSNSKHHRAWKPSHTIPICRHACSPQKLQCNFRRKAPPRSSKTPADGKSARSIGRFWYHWSLIPGIQLTKGKRSHFISFRPFSESQDTIRIASYRHFRGWSFRHIPYLLRFFAVEINLSSLKFESDLENSTPNVDLLCFLVSPFFNVIGEQVTGAQIIQKPTQLWSPGLVMV